jgi:hypothetical protein
VAQVRSLKNNSDFLRRLFLTFAVCTFFSLDTAFGAETGKDGWMIVQQHKDLGTNTFYLTHDAVKIVNKNFGFTVLLAAPFKVMAIYRPDEHIVFNTVPGFTKTNILVGLMSTKPTVYQSLEQYGEEDVHGLHVKKYRSRTAQDEIWTISNINLAPAVLDLIHNYYQIKNPLLPYRKISYVGEDHSKHKNLWLTSAMTDIYQGGRITLIETVSAKKMKFTPKDFAYPNGYKEVREVGPVFVSRSGSSKLTNIIEDLVLPEDKVKK